MFFFFNILLGKYKFRNLLRNALEPRLEIQSNARQDVAGTPTIKVQFKKYAFKRKYKTTSKFQQHICRDRTLKFDNEVK